MNVTNSLSPGKRSPDQIYIIALSEIPPAVDARRNSKTSHIWVYGHELSRPTTKPDWRRSNF